MVVAAVMTCGSKVGDLTIFCEVVRHRAQIWGGRSLGCVPDRWCILVFRSSSSELVVIAVHQHLWARSSFSFYELRGRRRCEAALSILSVLSLLVCVIVMFPYSYEYKLCMLSKKNYVEHTYFFFLRNTYIAMHFLFRREEQKNSPITYFSSSSFEIPGEGFVLITTTGTTNPLIH